MSDVSATQELQQAEPSNAAAVDHAQNEETESTAAQRSQNEVLAMASGGGGGGPTASERAFASAASHHHIPGGDRNVNPRSFNHNHRDGNQASRLSLHGHEPKIAHASPVYASDGSVTGHASPGPIKVNAGQICHIKIGAHHVRCVFTHGPAPGWIPTHAFHNAHELTHVMESQAHKMDQERHAHHDRARDGHVKTIVANPMPGAFEQLYTKPHEVGQANHAHDYFMRPSGYANLLYNVPTWTHDGGGVGERFGVAGDLVHPGQQFHDLGQRAQSPLFHHNSKHQVNHITFAYGYIINNAGEKRLGWMNHHLLG
jgi:hypothetical protein